MKHWADQDFADAKPIRLTREERRRVRAMFAQQPAGRRKDRAHVGSLIGLSMAIGTLVLLAWVLAPGEPVSVRLLP